MLKQLLKCCLLAAFLGALVGCKVAVIVVEGGRVTSQSPFFGFSTCHPGNVCIHDGVNFDQTYSPIPDPGWRFVRWNEGTDFLCAGDTGGCEVSNAGLWIFPPINAIINSDFTLYLMPIFERIPEITDTITVNGREWAQPDLFANLSWNYINGVCGAGPCSETTALNDFYMGGWHWASVDEVNEMFNAYAGPGAVGPGASGLTEIDSTWAPAFFADGWRPFDPSSTGDKIVGHIRVNGSIPNPSVWIEDQPVGGQDSIHNGLGNINGDINSDTIGGWFYRDP